MKTTAYIKGIGKNILSETEAIEAAKAECTVSYDTVRAYFDYTAGVWEVPFRKADMAGGDQTIQTIRIGAQGELQNVAQGE